MFSRICVIAVIAAACSAAEAADSGPPATPHSKNLVTNPSLEEKIEGSGLPQGWGSFYAEPAGSYIYSIVEGGRTGKKAMRIAGSGTFGVMPANRIEIDRTKRYVVRGWIKVKGDADATADVKFHYYGADGRYLDQTRIGHVSPTTDDWQFVTVTDKASSIPQAKFIGLAFSATGRAEAWYDDLELIAFEKETLPKDFEDKHGITRSPQLALLGRRVGNWVTETTIKPCVWVPNGSKTTGAESMQWALGGQFIEGKATTQTTGEKSLFLMTFDRQRKAYRSWYFDSQGVFPRGESIGTWDQATQKLTFESTDDNNVHSVVWQSLADENTLTWGSTWMDKKGQVLLDMEGTATRKKE